tara:strand:- start:297 stop:986 length:690 start_codon:yes stop_codon:yes gene_type:complete
MSAFLTSKKDLSTIAFIWGQIFADSKKESFETVVSNKDHAARLLEFNLDIESILFELLISDNLDSLRARYSDCRDLSREKLIESWTSETMEYENPNLEKISNKDIENIIGSYTYQSCEFEGFKTSYGFRICKMIIDKINEILPKEFQDKKEGYAKTSDSFYNKDYNVNMTKEEYKEEYKPQSEQWKKEEKITYREDLDLSLTDSEYSQYESDMGHNDDDAQEIDTSVFM